LKATENRNKAMHEEHSTQRKLLWTVLLINAGFFLLEMTTGLISRSMGLVADSLDMLADAFVYGISLIAVGGTLSMKKNTARTAGILQFLLALVGFAEVIRRSLHAEMMPDYKFMIFISLLALVGNSICLYLLQKSKSKEAHIQASKIFTANDVLINIGVIIAGLLVLWLKSIIPDLIIGTIVFLIVFKAAVKIYRLSTT
jgi:Co/Zn/Cd efflux system component